MNEEYSVAEWERRQRVLDARLDRYVATGKPEDRQAWQEAEEFSRKPIAKPAVSQKITLVQRKTLTDEIMQQILDHWKAGRKNRCSPILHAKRLGIPGVLPQTVLLIWREHFKKEFDYAVAVYPLHSDEIKQVPWYYDQCWLRPIYDKHHFLGWSKIGMEEIEDDDDDASGDLG